MWNYIWIPFLISLMREVSSAKAASESTIFLPSDAVAGLTSSCPAPDSRLNYRPIIGILSYPGNGASARLNNATNASYIAASYVKFVESTGARVFPLIYNEPSEVLQEVGLPNVGKSTLFNTLTKLSIPAENFPFCTIEPNEARVHIPDERFEWLCQQFKPKTEVSAFLEIHDIAGLVKGAHEGQGLGNNFLSHIRAVDGIFHVLRAFEDPDIIHVDDSVDPIRDLDVITAELRLKDIEFMERRIDDLEKSLKRSNDKQLKVEHELCLKVKSWLNEGKDVRLGDWKAADIEILNTFQLLTAKPVVYLVNMNEKDYQRKKNKFLPKIHTWVQDHGGEPIIPFSCALERNLGDMTHDEAIKYCEDNKVQSALPKIIKTGFAAINLIYFFTAGPDEVKCWQIRRQTKAPQAAGAIHTDFERGFICAEVMKFDDLKELGTEAAVKAAGKYKQEGKTYVVQDGDIIFFKFNVSSGGKK